MRNAPWLALCFMICVVCVVCVSRTVHAADTPNLVLIFIDDMGYGDIGPYGSKLNRTPHLDKMAAEGMKLTSFYAAPVCSASRAQLMTGSYAPRVSVPGVFFPAGRNGLNPDEHTVADYLKEAGYATMCVGKWHLGDQREFLPTRHGFDGYLGIPYSNDMGRVSTETGKKVHPLIRDESVAELLEDEGQRRITRLYTEEAVKFIENSKDKPFFLYLPHTAMHVPLYPHKDFAGKSNNGTYGDWVEEVDWSVGQVLDTLRRLKLEKNTLVLFTSDNGPWASKGNRGGVSGPLRGSKGGTLEGGVRVPTIAWWPGKIEAGATVDAVSGTTDVLPTFVSLAGGKLRDDVKIDGKDISPILLGETTQSPHEAWYYYRGRNLMAVRSGPWKLALRGQSIGMGFRNQPDDIKKAGRLYNLADDIGETTDVAAKHPDVVERLTKLAEAMRADIGDGKPGPGVRPAGSVSNPVTLYPTQSKKKRGRKKASGKPIDWKKVKVGDVYSADSAPPVAGKPFTVSCTIERKATGDGVLVAHGGSAVGYALYVKGEQLVFALRHGSDKVTRVTSPLSAGASAKVVATLKKDGTATLQIGDSEPASAKSPGTLGGHPAEELCVGHDNGNPVDDEAPTDKWAGAITGVAVTVSK